MGCLKQNLVRHNAWQSMRLAFHIWLGYIPWNSSAVHVPMTDSTPAEAHDNSDNSSCRTQSAETTTESSHKAVSINGANTNPDQPGLSRVSLDKANETDAGKEDNCTHEVSSRNCDFGGTYPPSARLPQGTTCSLANAPANTSTINGSQGSINS